MARRRVRWYLLAGLLGSVGGTMPPARGQTIDLQGPSSLQERASSIGRSPGESGIDSGGPGADQQLFGGRPGAAQPRVPVEVSSPGGRERPEDVQGIAAPTVVPLTDVPIYGTLALPADGVDDGPPDGLTLDMAIERLVRENLEIRAQALEIPQADADVLTASLRANPIFFADYQLIPYGRYGPTRPGGQPQVDVNISHPFDLSGKRIARTIVATQAKRIVEAQFQDYTRLQIDNLYRTYVDVLAARETVRFAVASVEGLNRIYQVTEDLLNVGGLLTRADLNRIKIQRDAAQIGLIDAEEGYRRSKRNLATLLNLPPQGSDHMEIRGTIRDLAPPPPDCDYLIRLSLQSRPDLTAFRLGVRRAQADVRLQRANRFEDIYVLYQPYTAQINNFEPEPVRNAYSWALGVTVPLPIYNRNQGNIARAKINVTQSNIELANQERLVVNEVLNAEREYAITRAAVERIEQELLPSATQVLSDSERLYRRGEENVVAFLNARQNYNEVAKQYRDTAVRHRRSMLFLNTALGVRILP